MNLETAQEIDSSLEGDGQVEAPITFVSYSRRQLYFAESIALHLQKHGINVWFDLQQLQAGTVWAEGLEGGVRDADRLVLIVSKASLESPYTRAEWLELVHRGDPVVLILFEPVDLPEEMQGLPTYDFRSGFKRNLQDLVAFLKGDAEPRYDRVPAGNRFGLSSRFSGAVWLTLTAHFGCFIAYGLSLLVAIILGIKENIFPNADTWSIAVFPLAVGAWYAIPFLNHTHEYRKVKRGVLINLLLIIPTFIAAGLMGDFMILSEDLADLLGASLIYWFIFGGMTLLLLFVYLYLLRYSQGLLRWMCPEDDLQRLRRRAHQWLTTKEVFGVIEEMEVPSTAVTYAIHADDADAPFERFIEGLFKEEGHECAREDEEPQHHVVVLSNRSSAAWAQTLANEHAGKIVFVVASTIEFTESLAEVGRYQWVDSRDMNRREIAALARSLGNTDACKREAALETTPAMIDQWKVPTGISALKRVLEWLGIYVLVFGLTDLIGAAMNILELIPTELQGEDGDSVRSAALVLAGVICFWLAEKGLVYRKVTSTQFYGLLVGIIVIVTVSGEALPKFTEDVYWLPGALMLLVVLNSWFNGRAWLPAFSKIQRDEVGIKQSIDRSFKKKRVLLVTVSVFIIVVFVVYTLIVGPGL